MILRLIALTMSIASAMSPLGRNILEAVGPGLEFLAVELIFGLLVAADLRIAAGLGDGAFVHGRVVGFDNIALDSTVLSARVLTVVWSDLPLIVLSCSRAWYTEMTCISPP